MNDKWKRRLMHWHMRKAARLKHKSKMHLYKSDLIMVELQVSHGIEPMVKLPGIEVYSPDLTNVDEYYEDIYGDWLH
jgi:hypothetical protein